MLTCPLCGSDISSMLPKDLPEKDLRFCPQCGGNYRYSCPVCHDAMISIIGIGYPDPDEIRCPECKSLFYVCEKCGRLSEPYLQYCPNEECNGLLKSSRLPSETYNGTNFSENFQIKLDSSENKYISITKELYKTISPDFELYSAKLVGGYLFVWHDSLIDILDIDNNFRKIKSISTEGAKESNIAHKMALLGDNIIIASEEKFLWFNLNGKINLDEVKGKPIELISGHCGVAMWTKYKNSYCLYTALYPQVNSAPTIKTIDLPSDKYQLMENSNCLAMTPTAVYWQGKSENIYKYDFFDDSLKEIAFDRGRISRMWTNSENQISVAFSEANKFTIYTNLEGERNSITNEFNQFIDGLYVYEVKDLQQRDIKPYEYAYVLGDNLMKFGDGKYPAPNGKHINSILCKEYDRNNIIVLLSMFKNIQMENSFVNIYAQRKDSSSPDLIWTNSKIDPIEMLCFENKIFILHKKGVVVIERIKDTQKSSTSDNNASQSNIYSESSINIQMNHVVEIPNHDIETKKSDIYISPTHSEALIRKEPPKSEIDFSNNDDSPEETTITCPYCGMKQPKDGTKFCSDCGKLIENQSNDTGKLPKPKAESDKLQKLLEQFKQKN